MNLKKAIKDTCFRANLRSTTKNGVIEELVDLLIAAGRILDRQNAINCVLERERKMSTGMQHGVAIPHGKTGMVENLVTAIGVRKEGIDFGSQDGQPSKIFIMTISSSNRTGPHMEYLAEVSKLLSNPAIRQRVLDAATDEELAAALTDEQA